MTTTTEFRFEQLVFPVTTLSGDTYNRKQAEALLEKYRDRITVKTGPHEEVSERYVVESYTKDGEPWNWDYQGPDRYNLERAVLTWMIVNDLDDDLGHVLTITLGC